MEKFNAKRIGPAIRKNKIRIGRGDFFSGYKIQSDRQSYMIQINATQASSLYGRKIAKIRSANAAGGNSDITAAKSIDPRISEEFAKYGIQ